MAEEIDWPKAGRWISQLRGHRGWKQEDIPNLEIELTAYREFENGKRKNPRRTTIGAIERAFGLTTGTLEAVARGDAPPELEMRVTALETRVGRVEEKLDLVLERLAIPAPGE